MSDGGYSRVEKDFLGNERMVHYDASGNMLGASDIIREPDGTIRVSNDTVSVNPDDLPHVEVIVPPQTAAAIAEPIPVRVMGVGTKSNMNMNQLVMYSIAAFIGTCLLTLGVMSFFRSNGSSGSTRTEPIVIHRNDAQPAPDVQPGRENFPNDPKPRNDDQPGDVKPSDQGQPDSNMDDNRPRIQDNNNDPGPPPTKVTDPNKGSSNDPIDLRGDDGNKKDPPKKGDPGADPLKGDGIH